MRGVAVRRFATRETRDIEEFNRFSDWIFNYPHTDADELEWLRRQGPVAPGAARAPAAHAPQLRRPDLLHLSLRADRAGPADRLPRAASWCRPRTTSRRSSCGSTGAVPGHRAYRLQHRRRAALPELDVRHPRHRRSHRRLRRRPAAEPPHPARTQAARPPPRAERRARQGLRQPARMRGRGEASAAAIGCTGRSRSTAGASIRARAARSCCSTSTATSATAATRRWC